MPNLSINLLYDSYENPEAAAHSVYPFLDRAPVDALQVTTGARKEQGRTFALQLKQRYPTLDAILRLMPDENPALYQRYPNPADYVASVAPWASGGLMLGIGNEAGVSDLAAQNAWYAATVEGLGKLGIRSVTPSVQTHNRFPAAAFDATYRMLAKYGGMFSLHYYGDPANGLPIDPIHETVEAYCAAQGIRIQFAITELGYAKWIGSFAGYNGRIASADYAAQLVAAARRWPRVRFFVYCFGAQSPWQDFDISKDQTVQDAIVAHNLEVVTPALPDGTSPAPKLIDVSAGLKLRSAPALSSTTSRILKYHERVTVYGDPVELADSYSWQRLTDSAGLAGWSANWVDGEPSWADPAAVDVPHFSVDMPFFSQNTPTASKNNDCGPSCALMLLSWKYQRLGLLAPALLTVDDLSRHTSLASKDDGLTLAEVSALLLGFGVANTLVRPLTTAAIAQYIQQGIAPLALVNDLYFGGKGVGHFVVVTKVGEQGFWTNDPDFGGKDYYITTPTLDKALSEVAAFATYPYQGLTLAA